MTLFPATTVRRGLYGVFAGTMIGALSFAVLAGPANAEPDSPEPAPPVEQECSAAGLTATINEVTADLSEYFEAHPDTNQALIEITRQPAFVAVGQFDGYFNEHPVEADALRAIQAPLTAYKDRCGMQVTPGEAFTVLSDL